MLNKLSMALALILSGFTFFACSESTPTDTSKNDDNPPQGLQVEEKQMALINKMTATWCGTCGTWGWDVFKEIIDETKGKAVLMGTYGSSASDMTNQTAQQFNFAFAPGTGYPAFCYNGQNFTQYVQGYVDSEATQETIIDKAAKFNRDKPIVNAGYEMLIEGNSLTINTRTRFFQQTEGKYYLGVYVIENGVGNEQAGRGYSNHLYVLRGTANETSWGEQVASGKIEAGFTGENSYSIEIEEDWNTDHLSAALVIWEKVGDKYIFVNAYTKY